MLKYIVDSDRFLSGEYADIRKYAKTIIKKVMDGTYIITMIQLTTIHLAIARLSALNLSCTIS